MDLDQLSKQTTESGQVLVEIEPHIWVDFETIKNKKNENVTQPVNPPFQPRQS